MEKNPTTNKESLKTVKTYTIVGGSAFVKDNDKVQVLLSIYPEYGKQSVQKWFTYENFIKFTGQIFEGNQGQLTADQVKMYIKNNLIGKLIEIQEETRFLERK